MLLRGAGSAPILGLGTPDTGLYQKFRGDSQNHVGSHAGSRHRIQTQRQWDDGPRLAACGEVDRQTCILQVMERGLARRLGV